MKRADGVGRRTRDVRTDMTQSSINVLAVVHGMKTGGLESYLLNVLRTIDRDRFNVTIVCTGHDTNDFGAELDALGVRVIFCPNPFTQIGYVVRISRVMRELDIHVVCDFRSDFAAPTLWAARRLGIKSRIGLYRNKELGFRPNLLRNACAALLHWGTRRWATRVIGNSQCVLDAFFSDWRSSDKFILAYNGVDLNRFASIGDPAGARRELGIADDAVLIGHVGRFHMQKNHSVILTAFAQVRQEVDHAHLLLVGEGNLRPGIETLIGELGLSGSVTLAGRRTDVPRMLSAMDVFVFPSLYEGHPNALIEAMACGLPIVASNIQPVVETMPPNADEDLFAPHDATDIAQRLVHYCRNAEHRGAVGARLRRHVEAHFDLEARANELCRYWVKDL